MRRLGIATIAAVAVLAAPAAQAEPSEFAGFYAGAHVGYVDANADFDGGDLDEGDTIGGLQVGYNMLSGNLIWGIETDLSLTGANPKGTCPFDAALSCDVDIDGLGTLRARAGYASGDWLFYVTGGAAAGHFEVATSGAAGSSHDDEGRLGWTVGAGLEYLVGGGMPGPRNVGVKLEYRYVDLFDIDINRTPTTGASEDMGFSSHTIMIGVNWHF